MIVTDLLLRQDIKYEQQQCYCCDGGASAQLANVLIIQPSVSGRQEGQVPRWTTTAAHLLLCRILPDFRRLMLCFPYKLNIQINYSLLNLGLHLSTCARHFNYP